MNMDKQKSTYVYIKVFLLLSLFLLQSCKKEFTSLSLQPPLKKARYKIASHDEQEESRFMTFPLELQSYILGFLDSRSFIKSSIVCRCWREAAYIAGEQKALDISDKKLDDQNFLYLSRGFFSLLTLRSCELEGQSV